MGSPGSLARRRQWHPTPVLLPGKSHGQRSLVGCSPWGREQSDTTERLHFHFSLSCIGEGNGNPLQCSCLENPRDGGAWWAAIYGVAQSWTRLKRLSSSSSMNSFLPVFHSLHLTPWANFSSLSSCDSSPHLSIPLWSLLLTSLLLLFSSQHCILLLRSHPPAITHHYTQRNFK